MNYDSQGTQLDTIIIFTGQMARLAEWYEQALGLAAFESSPDHVGQRLGSIYLGFDQVTEDLPETPMGVTLWFMVDDIESTFDRLVQLGARVRYAPTKKPWGVTLASVYDPDGNVLGISQREPPPAVA